MRKNKRGEFRLALSVLTVGMLVLSLGRAAAPIARKAAANVVASDMATAITNAADRLVALQLDTDYGWNWEVIGPAEYSGSSSINIYGVTALGLLNAYKLTGTETYKEAARKIADMMKGYSTNYRDFHDTGLGQSWDLRFLMSYAELSGDTAYSDFARNYWEWIKSPGSGHELYADGNKENFYQFYISYGVTPGYAIWDCADFGLAALAVGDTAWAKEMANTVLSHLVDITDTDDYRFIGWGRALEFLQAVGPTTYTEGITSLISTLKGKQNDDGSWGMDGIVQDTAYVIMGLTAVAEKNAAQRGADWLISEQLGNGEWINSPAYDNKEYSQVDSEVIRAYWQLCQLQ